MIRRVLLYCFIAAIPAWVLSCSSDPTGPGPASNGSAQSNPVDSHGVPHIGSDVSVVARGLNNPRGLKFGPDGMLYVAEGGTGGSNSTLGNCGQVAPPIGPYTGGMSARISRIDVTNGAVTTVADNLPSAKTSAEGGSDGLGMADVLFVDGQLYALYAGAGCSHGNANVPNQIAKVNNDGSTTMLVDLSAFQQANPVQNPPTDDFEPDGTWYNMIDVNGDIYAVEPNHGEIDHVTTGGTIDRLIDVSASQGHIVPTSVAFWGGNFYMGNLGTFPIVKGSENIYQIKPNGDISVYATGFTTILGVLFDEHGNMYVLENTTHGDFPTPATGDVIRVDATGGRATVVSGLYLPTAMALGPDGYLYISNDGLGSNAIGGGEIVRVRAVPSLAGSPNGTGTPAGRG